MSKHEAKDKKTSRASRESNEDLADLKVTNHETSSEPSEQNGKTVKESAIISEKTVKNDENAIENQLAQMNDKYLRLYSEFDNYRKRTLKEKTELSKTAASELIIKLLPVLDDFERAIKAIEPDTDPTGAHKEGILLIFNKMKTTLNQQGLEQMRTIGEKFDTDFHEAITNIPAPTPEQKNTILDEVEKGYLLNGKVIRYAKVVVGN